MSAVGDVGVEWGEGAVFGLGLGAFLGGRGGSSLWGARGSSCAARASPQNKRTSWR